jgi:two-component system, NarL family, response regulator LiaR
MIRVLIVDDHEVVRQGLRFALEQQADIDVVGECADGIKALAAISELQPDVMLLDMVMPGMDGLAVLRALDGVDPRPVVIVLTSFLNTANAMDAVRAGAKSYLSKTAATTQVIEAVRTAASGGSLLDPGVAAHLLERVKREPADGPLRMLSPREREVLGNLARGRSNREIARTLSLSEETIKSHVSNILTKLELQDRTQAAIFGLQQGLVSLKDALAENDES